MWTPDLAERSGPRYIAIANAIAEDIGRQTLTPGDKLPPHRELAWQLGVTVGTISRAYREAEQRGLVVGEVGRGTFIRSGQEQNDDFARRNVLFAYNKNDNPDLIDFKINRPAPPGKGEALRDMLTELAAETRPAAPPACGSKLAALCPSVPATGRSSCDQRHPSRHDRRSGDDHAARGFAGDGKPDLSRYQVSRQQHESAAEAGRHGR